VVRIRRGRMSNAPAVCHPATEMLAVTMLLIATTR
jgi:hypothetical protein